MPPSLSEIELAEGTSSELARVFHNAIERNLERPQGREVLQKLRGRVLLRAEDRESAVTLEFDAGRVRIADGGEDGARIRILGDAEAIVDLTRLPLRGGMPEVWSAPGRLALKRQLGGELTIRGLVLHSRQLLRFLRLIAA